ncbi:uncharacterized protein BDZ83DRAFT_2081 [Colletotrichum acutatum]|uniref:Uncharacterized protein n=1 Tax=Glomerella acutata TaxID=27357 RepID=A0AAD9D2T6_GLOAC|nr:uncharacterized protein BDZ83DRAFT_2081 [Colletotrichum acutatum]KAK1731722.1 hypothetical protein BDZ83DRAFT_2081 [Colletotrichum acutatum]
MFRNTCWLAYMDIKQNTTCSGCWLIQPITSRSYLTLPELRSAKVFLNVPLTVPAFRIRISWEDPPNGRLSSRTPCAVPASSQSRCWFQFPGHEALIVVSCRICCCMAPAWHEQADLSLLTHLFRTAVCAIQHGQPTSHSPANPIGNQYCNSSGPRSPPALIEAGIVRNVASCRPHWLIRTGADQLNGPSRTRRLASLVTSAPHWTSPL